MKKKILVLALAISASALVYALPSGHAFEITYYSDASKTQTVGERTYHCVGGFYAFGDITAYSDELDLGPCNGTVEDPWYNIKSPGQDPFNNPVFP